MKAKMRKCIEYKPVMTNENVSLLVKNDLQTIDTCFDLIK